jgi:hypothetical protein
VYKIWVGSVEETRPVGKSEGSRKDNIKIDLHEIAYKDSGWIYVAQYRDSYALENTVMLAYKEGNTSID